MGWLSILFLVSVAIYTVTLKWVARDEGATLMWRHALWYVINDAFFWVRQLGWIERPDLPVANPVPPVKSEVEKKPVKS